MCTIRCPECKMVNWATALNCKRCAHLFQPAETAVVSPATTAPPSFQNHAAEPDYSPDFAEPQVNTPAFQPQVNWGNNGQHNQNYGQQNYGQNYRQPNYAPHLPPPNQKIGLAVTSMVLGILAVLTTIFLIGVLLAPIGLILGIVALVKANRKPVQYGGKGFAIAGIAMSTLITLLIPIIVAIAVPNIMKARRMANEMGAIRVMQTLADAETEYRKGAGKGYCADLKTLIGSNLIDGVLEKDQKDGYRYLIVNYPLSGCEITATPLSTSDGERSFYFSTDDSLIRVAKKNGKPADKHDPLLGDNLEDEFKKEFTQEEAKPQSNFPMEGAAINTLRTIQAAQTTHMATVGMGDCCADFKTLAEQGLIKPDLADGEDVGYRFSINKVSKDNFEITATPLSNAFGSRSFFISPRDGLRGAVKNGAPADKKDPPVD